MLCIFCDDNKHLSQNCGIYSSNEARKNILQTKNRCTSCLTKKEDTFMCCKSNQKCYICFSRSHHTVFCPDRDIAQNIYPSHIDEDLLSRFMEMLTLEERYSMIFICPDISNAIHVKPIKVKSIYSIDLQYAKPFFDLDVITATKGKIKNGYLKDYLSAAENNVISSTIKKIIFRIQRLEFTRVSISSDIFLKFLSSETTKLECLETTFQPKLSFQELLVTASNLEEICFDKTSNIEFGDSWPDDLLKLSHASKLKRICISISDLNFSAKSLSILMTKKSVPVSLFIDLPVKMIYDKQQIKEIITSKFYKFFDQSFSGQPLKISISYTCDFEGKIETIFFDFKNVLIV